MNEKLKFLDVLDLIISMFEETVYCYNYVVETVDNPEIKELFRELVEKEKRHLEVFSSLKSKVCEEKGISDEFCGPPGMEEFFRFIIDENIFVNRKQKDEILKGLKSPIDALNLAKEHKKNAILLYQELLEYIHDMESKLAIEKVIEEEKRDLGRIYEMITKISTGKS